MERELIGGSIQILSFLMGLLGVTLQRRAMIVDVDEDFVLVHSLSPLEEEDYGTFASANESRRRQMFDATALDAKKVACMQQPRRCCHTLRCHCQNISKLWLLGFCIFYGGQVVEIFALSFASQSTVVAVGSLGVFVNAFVAVKVFHETFQFLPPRHERCLGKIFHWDLLNLIIMVCGSVLTVLFAPRVPRKEERAFDSTKLLGKWIEMPFVIYFAAGLILVPGLLFRFFRIKRGPLVLALVLALLSSFSITMSKVITELVEDDSLFNYPAMAMVLCWVFLLILQVVLLQIGLKNFEQSGVFSVGGVLGGACTILSGMLYYQTYKNFEDDQAKYGFGVGVVLLLYGILVFSQRRNVSREEMKRRLLADTVALEEEEERLASALERANGIESEDRQLNTPLILEEDLIITSPAVPQTQQQQQCAIV